MINHMLVPSNLCVQYDSEAYMKKKMVSFMLFWIAKVPFE